MSDRLRELQARAQARRERMGPETPDTPEQIAEQRETSALMWPLQLESLARHLDAEG